MERFARFLPAAFIPFRQFGRLRHLRSLIPCQSTEPLRAPGLFDALPALPSLQPAFARVSLNTSVHAQSERRAPVRVYRGESRVIMVGNIDEVSRMIDRCIDDERAGLGGGLFA
jgi:hypothetical protein